MMRSRRMILVGLVATALSVPVLAGRPATGPDQRAVALVPPLPSLRLPLPSMPLPSLPLPSLPPLPTLPPVATLPPLLPTPPIPVVTPSPTAPGVGGPPPSVRPSTAGEDSPSPTPSDETTATPTAGSPTPDGSAATPPGGSPTVEPAPTAGEQSGPGAFDGVVGPVVALGVSMLLALIVLLAQLMGGAALVPFVRRTLGELRLRRWTADPGAAGSEPVQPGGDATAT